VTAEAAEAALAAAERYLLAEDHDSAEAVVGALVDRRPGDPRARELYGRVLLGRALLLSPHDAERQDLLERSLEQYHGALAADESSAGLHQSAGSVAVMAGRTPVALEHYLRAAELEPLDPQHALFAAQLLIQLRRHDEARGQLDRVLSLDPDLPVAHASLAIIAMEEQRYDEAVRRIDEARAIDPGDLNLRVQEARIHRRRGVPAAAVDLLAALDAVQRGLEPVTRELAAAYDALGRPEAAARAWMHRHVRQREDPMRWKTALEVARRLLAAGQPDEAAFWLREARLLAPDAPEVLDLGRTMVEQGVSEPRPPAASDR
jgi:tetratricopeptide (TPR) repeat protein